LEAVIQSPHEKWPVRLYRKSVLKQNKVKQIMKMLGPTNGLQCLDVGGDNGVVSYLLRQRGGRWKSADLDDRTVQAIREVVGHSVFQIDGRKTQFHDDEFDRVVLVEVHGWSYAEVAELFEIPVGTVRSRLSRGRSMLQRALWEQARESGIAAGPGAERNQG
jgi:hypothetical protein